jgi:site-specific recombinase XerD
MRVHDWRHAFASSLVMAGVDLLTVQELGGWKSLDMVKRYATFSNKHKIDAINKI